MGEGEGEGEEEDRQAGLSDGGSSGDGDPSLYTATWEQAVRRQPPFLGLVHALSRDFLNRMPPGF